MTQQIINSVKSVIPLTKKEEKAFTDMLKIKHFKKKEFVLTEGDICREITFINKGSVRLFYVIEGLENTLNFFFPNDWYTAYESFLDETPSIENVQALEDTELLQFSKSDLYQLYDNHPVFEKLGRVMAENAFRVVVNRSKMLTNEQPQERYLKLIKNRPELFEKIPQHYIASYLGVKPESLSRIRRRIIGSK